MEKIANLFEKAVKLDNLTETDYAVLTEIFDIENKRKPNYCGIEGIKFIYRGEWADPELYYKDRYFNVYEVEDVFYTEYEEDCEQGYFSGTYAEYAYSRKEEIYDLLDWIIEECNL
jgi:hypothetical protein